MSITDAQRIYLLKEIFRLSKCCPFDSGNPRACPFHEIRTMGVIDKYISIHELCDLRLLNILACHQRCFERKRELKRTSPQLPVGNRKIPNVKLDKPVNPEPKGATVQFTETSLPFIFVAEVSWGYSDNNVKVHLYQGAAPQVAVIYGSDNPKHVRIARNDLNLPERLLHHIYNMGTNRAIIASFEQRNLNPEKKHGLRHSLWQNFNKDRERVLKEWESIKGEFLKTISDFLNPLK